MIALKVRSPFAIVDGHNLRSGFITVERSGVHYDLGGETVELFRIGVLAQAFDRSTRTLKQWEQAELLPPPLFQIQGSTHRHYSATQVLNVHRLVRARWQGRQHVLAKEMNELFSALRSIWREPDVVVTPSGAVDANALFAHQPRGDRDHV